MAYPNNGIVYSNTKNEALMYVATWMNFGSIKLNERKFIKLNERKITICIFLNLFIFHV